MWIIFGALASLIGFIIGRDTTPAMSPRTTVVTSGTLKQRLSAVQLLTYCLKRGESFPPGLVLAAKVECSRSGDMETLGALERYFPSNPPPSAPPPSSQAVPPQAAIVGKASPVYGTDSDQWCSFVSALATQPTSYADDHHVGRYHHNVRRLAELGIDPNSLRDEESQYAALETDIRDTLARNAKLINEFAGDVMSINGQRVPITQSGILGVIKCAGAEAARSWLSDEKDRLRHPNTTKIFLLTNGIF